MTTKDFIEGLTILRQHYKDADGYQLGAEHDIIYAYATDMPLTPEEVAMMFGFNWHQPNVDEDDEGKQIYNPEEDWGAFV